MLIFGSLYLYFNTQSVLLKALRMCLSLHHFPVFKFRLSSLRPQPLPYNTSCPAPAPSAARNSATTSGEVTVVQLLKPLWVRLNFTRGGATNLRGRVWICRWCHRQTEYQTACSRHTFSKGESKRRRGWTFFIPGEIVHRLGCILLIGNNSKDVFFFLNII